jgi:predicted alpha/beta-fold hydrolase
MFDSDDVDGSGLLGGKNKKDVETLLNAMGSQGWEVINIDWREFSGRLSFSGIAKREKP